MPYVKNASQPSCAESTHRKYPSQTGVRVRGVPRHAQAGVRNGAGDSQRRGPWSSCGQVVWDVCHEWVNRRIGAREQSPTGCENVLPLSITSRRYAWGAHGFVTAMVHDSSLRRALGHSGLAIAKESGCDMERRAMLPVTTAACSILKISSSASTRGQSPPPQMHERSPCAPPESTCVHHKAPGNGGLKTSNLRT